MNKVIKYRNHFMKLIHQAREIWRIKFNIFQIQLNRSKTQSLNLIGVILFRIYQLIYLDLFWKSDKGLFFNYLTYFIRILNLSCCANEINRIFSDSLRYRSFKTSILKILSRSLTLNFDK